MLKLSALVLLIGAFIFYSFFIYTGGTETAASGINDSAMNGKELWQQYNCTSCHQIYGLGGYLGPDLTNIVNKKGRDYAAAFIKSGVKAMPVFNLPENEVTALIDYLEYVGTTGSFPNRDVVIDEYGSFHIPVKSN